MGPLVKAIGAGVGFIAEATSSNKGKTITSGYSTVSPQDSLNETRDLQQTSLEKSISEDIDSGDDSDDSSDNELQWMLDEEVSKTEPAKKERDLQGLVKIDSLVSTVLSKSKPVPASLPSNTVPVILPQRRPGSRGRGFVRAYAPILDNYGVDQDTFLTFIENFDLSVKMSPALGIVQLGAGVVGFIPNGYAMIASTVTQVIVGVAMEYQTRSRGNSYMDEINEKLFKPRGLYAVIMTYVPNAQRPVTAGEVDLNALMDGKTDNSGSLLGPKIQKGESYGELELPESAPLVFPGIDEATQQKLQEANALKKGMRWTGDYMDRRSQARYIHNNPDSRLNPSASGEKPTFKSSLGDPNHPAFQGSWPTLFSGGRIAPKAKVSKDEKRALKQQRRDEKRAYRAKEPRQAYGGDPYTLQTPKQSKKQKKKLKSKILYLMVLPIPSQTELKEAEQQVGGFSN